MSISPSSVTQNGVTAWLTLDGSTVTVEVSSVSYSWRINGTNSGGDHGTYYIKENRDDSGSFVAQNGHKYAFQVAKSGVWSSGAIFTVTLDDEDDDSGDSGSSGDSYGINTLHINQGEGTKITVTVTWSDDEDRQWDELSDGATIYYPNDRFDIKVEALPGYEIDYYNQLPFQLDNLVKVSGETVYKLIYDGDATVSATAKPKGLVYISNGTSFDEYQIFIDNGSSWDQYIPYIDNGSGWDMCN